MKSVSYSKGPDGRLELQMTRYLDSFPFDNFIVIRDVEALPEVLSQTLRQFMERVRLSHYAHSHWAVADPIFPGLHRQVMSRSGSGDERRE